MSLESRVIGHSPVLKFVESPVPFQRFCAERNFEFRQSWLDPQSLTRKSFIEDSVFLHDNDGRKVNGRGGLETEAQFKIIKVTKFCESAGEDERKSLIRGKSEN